jgi:hypothetical protein
MVLMATPRSLPAGDGTVQWQQVRIAHGALRAPQHERVHLVETSLRYARRWHSVLATGADVWSGWTPPFVETSPISFLLTSVPRPSLCAGQLLLVSTCGGWPRQRALTGQEDPEQTQLYVTMQSDGAAVVRWTRASVPVGTRAGASMWVLPAGGATPFPAGDNQLFQACDVPRAVAVLARSPLRYAWPLILQ